MSDYQIKQVSIQPIDLLKETKERLGSQYFLFVGICFVGMLLGSVVPFAIILGPMMCGIYYCFRNCFAGENVTFDQLFKGFDYFKDACIAGILIGIVSMFIFGVFYAVLIALIFAGGSDGGAIFGLISLGLYLMMMVALVLISMLTMFTFPLILDKGLGAIDAIKASIAGAKANLMPLLIWMVVIFILSAIAIVLCFVPVLFVLPLNLGGTYLIYQRIYGAETVQAAAPPLPPPPAPTA